MREGTRPRVWKRIPVLSDNAPGTELEEALRRLLAVVMPLAEERVSVWDAGGRVAARDVVAAGPVPHFARAAMDGYVCHDADLHDSSVDHAVTLRVTGTVRMGESPGTGPGRGEAWTITTGGPIPNRGDHVLPVEGARLAGDQLTIARPGGTRANIAAAGEDIRPGARIAVARAPISPAAAGALAACGIADVGVYRRPRVAVVATGTELVEVSGAGPAGLPPGRVVNSNSIALAALLRAAGYVPEYRGIVADRPEALREAFRVLPGEYDVVISTGGVSIGRYDAVHRTWLDLGAERIVGRVELKPGGPFFAGRIRGTWVIGLSGTPVACLAAYHLLVLPVLRRLEGRDHAVRPTRLGVLAGGFPRATDRTRALWARVEDREEGLPEVDLLVGRTEGNAAALVPANALVLIPPGTPALPAGTRVSALMLDGCEDRNTLTVRSPGPGPCAVGVVGESGAGKTTVISGLLRRLAADGVRAAVVKHAAHGFTLDRRGSDSARLVEAGAAITVVAGPEETAVRIAARLENPDRLIRLAEAAAVEAWGAVPDCILIEGFDHPGRPVIQVGRPKPGTVAGEVLASVPAVADLSPPELEEAVTRAAGALRARLRLPSAAWGSGGRR